MVFLRILLYVDRFVCIALSSGEFGGNRFFLRCNLSLNLIDFMMPTVIHSVFLCLCLRSFTVLVEVCLLVRLTSAFVISSQLYVGSECRS